MRTSVAFWAFVLLMMSLGEAMGQPGRGYDPGCSDLPPGCDYVGGRPAWHASPPCPSPCDYPEEEAGPPRAGPPAPELPPIAPGAYAAPPRSGATVGEQVGGILGGLRIRIPEISIGLPQLEWTGHTRFRRASHMRLDEATAPFVANPHYETALLMREIERRQLQLLEEQRAGRERAARAGDEEDELERLRESERQLREQVTQMQRQIDILIMRLGPPPRRQPCDSAPSPNEPEHLPCPTSEVSPAADPTTQHIPAWSSMQRPQTVSYNATPAHYVPNAMVRPSTAAQPFQHGGPADSTPISSAPRAPLMRLPPVDQW